MEIIFIGLLIQALVFGFFCSYIAGEKNRSKSNWFVLGFLFSILAVLALMAIPKIENDKSSSDSWHSAKPIAKQKAQESLFDGERNVSSSSYQLFLTKRFDIEKNSTLEKFVIDNTVFDTLADALGEAHSRYTKHLSMLKVEEDRLRREAAEREQSLIKKKAERKQNLAREEAEREKLRRANEALEKEREEHRKKVLKKAMPWVVAATLLVSVIIGFVIRDHSIREESVRLAWQATGKVIKDCAECPEMVAIPAGSFEMGSTGPKGEQPIHHVTVGGFLLSRTEITQRQWRAVMSSNPSRFARCGDDCPVESVSWDDAQKYAKRLSQKTGETYRLPSEAEWEYAARAGSRGEWSFGDNESQLGQCAWFSDNSTYKTQPVAQKKPNVVGLYDMHGNVGEWTQDVRHENYQGAPSDGSAWMSGGDQAFRVIRGGSWGNGAGYCRSANRYYDGPGNHDNGVGFRIARTL